MKLVKELPISVYTTIKLSLKKFNESNSDYLNEKTVPVIVSLTSIPTRLNTLHLVVKSILNQSKLPEKIVLWLNYDLKNDIPKKLQALVSKRFEIKFSGLTSSHRKLIHSLDEYPNKTIITIDDDLMYRKDLIELLYNEHLKSPKHIIANRTVNLSYDESGNHKPFKEWKNSEKLNNKVMVPIGAWGILYPPNSLYKDVVDPNRFMDLTPKADDLWFKAMALMQGTLSVEAALKPKDPIPIANTQKVSLKKINLGKDLNTKQWAKIEKEYNIKNIVLN
ncbi:glycosyl transferase [uncultured Zobellia sp.]|uniref:glycosyl transferase n=1 Tax=uncultured Zobellia sp. TaxID=255433 RepID=UPI00259378A5|nr:glycosyl transferase [uncultured Zobellia sp.]